MGSDGQIIINNVGDAFSLGILGSYFVGALPAIALTLTIIWTALRIYEMCTVQGWLGKRKKKDDTSVD